MVVGTSSNKTVTSVEEEEEDTSVCDVCLDGEVQTNNEIIFCDKCDVAVHQACYGVETIPDGQWFCTPCSKNLDPKTLVCVLCPFKGGAYHQTDHRGVWAHALCGTWIPEVFESNEADGKVIINIDRMPAERFTLKCQICHKKDGACPQCAYGRCIASAHSYCIMHNPSAGFTTRINKVEASKYVWEVFCKKHSPSGEQDGTQSQSRQQHRQNSTKKSSATPTPVAPSSMMIEDTVEDESIANVSNKATPQKQGKKVDSTPSKKRARKEIEITSPSMNISITPVPSPPKPLQPSYQQYVNTAKQSVLNYMKHIQLRSDQIDNLTKSLQSLDVYLSREITKISNTSNTTTVSSVIPATTTTATTTTSTVASEISVNFGGKIIKQLPRNRFLHSKVKHTLLSSLFHPRWDKILPRDKHGNIYIDIEYKWIQPILDAYEVAYYEILVNSNHDDIHDNTDNNNTDFISLAIEDQNLSQPTQWYSRCIQSRLGVRPLVQGYTGLLSSSDCNVIRNMYVQSFLFSTLNPYNKKIISVKPYEFNDLMNDTLHNNTNKSRYFMVTVDDENGNVIGMLWSLRDAPNNTTTTNNTNNTNNNNNANSNTSTAAMEVSDEQEILLSYRCFAIIKSTLLDKDTAIDTLSISTGYRMLSSAMYEERIKLQPLPCDGYESPNIFITNDSINLYDKNGNCFFRLCDSNSNYDDKTVSYCCPSFINKSFWKYFDSKYPTVIMNDLRFAIPQQPLYHFHVKLTCFHEILIESDKQLVTNLDMVTHSNPMLLSQSSTTIPEQENDFFSFNRIHDNTLETMETAWTQLRSYSYKLRDHLQFKRIEANFMYEFIINHIMDCNMIHLYCNEYHQTNELSQDGDDILLIYDNITKYAFPSTRRAVADSIVWFDVQNETVCLLKSTISNVIPNSKLTRMLTENNVNEITVNFPMTIFAPFVEFIRAKKYLQIESQVICYSSDQSAQLAQKMLEFYEVDNIKIETTK